MTVKLTLNNASSTTTNVTIQIRGGDFELLGSHPLRVNGAFTFTGLSVSTHTVGFTVSGGASLNGTIDMPVAAGPGAAPTIQVNNVTGDTVYVEWPTSDGQTQQELTPGTPMTLSDFVPDTVVGVGKA